MMGDLLWLTSFDGSIGKSKQTTLFNILSWNYEKHFNLKRLTTSPTYRKIINAEGFMDTASKSMLSLMAHVILNLAG